MLLNSGHTYPKALRMQNPSFHASKTINSVHMIPKPDLFLFKILYTTYGRLHRTIEKIRLEEASGNRLDQSAQSGAKHQVASNFNL